MDDEAMKMARRIAASCPGPVLSPRCHGAMLRGECDDWHGVQAAYAAIIETREACATIAEDVINDMRGSGESDLRCARHRVTAAIRSGQHYGKDHPHA